MKAIALFLTVAFLFFTLFFYFAEPLVFVVKMV